MVIASFLLACLAVARGTRLVVEDRITASFRAKVASKHGPDAWQTYLAHCKACVSIWASAPVAVSWGAWAHYGGDVGAITSIWLTLLAVPAMSQVAMLLLSWERDM